LGGYISFSEAFLAGFSMVVVSSIIGAAYNLLFNAVIDPEYVQRVTLAIQNKTVEMMESRGVSQDMIDKTISDFQSRGIPSVGKQLITSLLTGLIGGAILSVISAAIVKKKDPETEF
jgi:hypothetical protein